MSSHGNLLLLYHYISRETKLACEFTKVNTNLKLLLHSQQWCDSNLAFMFGTKVRVRKNENWCLVLHIRLIQ